MSSKGIGPAITVLTTPIGGVAQAILKAITPIAQTKQSAPSSSFTVFFFIVVDPFMRKSRVELAEVIPQEEKALLSSARMLRLEARRFHGPSPWSPFCLREGTETCYVTTL
jgi:hypothetical protein